MILRSPRILRYLLAVLIGLSGCTISDEQRYQRLSYIALIDRDFRSFVADCQITDGKLYVPRRRVWNAPATPWEMKDAVCFYDDAYPLTMDTPANPAWSEICSVMAIADCTLQ